MKNKVPGYTPGMPQVNEMGSFCLSEKAGKKFPKSWVIVIGRDFVKSSPKKNSRLGDGREEMLDVHDSF